MEITKRERYLLKKEMNFHINRYLMANSCQRLNSEEKADHHIAISKILAEFILCRSDFEAWIEVHDFLADILTDRMDEVIGFPIHTPLYGDMYKSLGDKFFEVIVVHMEEIEKIVLNGLSNRD